MSIKLVAADMDGTLIKTSQELSPRTEKAVRDICDKGITFVMDTGRSNSEAELYYDRLPVDYAILANGAYILNLKTGESLYNKLISPKEALMIYDMYRQYDNLMFIQRDHVVYSEDDFKNKCLGYTEYSQGLAIIDLPYKGVPDWRKFITERDDPIEKFHVSFMYHDDAEKCFEQLSKLDYSVVWVGEYVVEVTHKEATKALALKFLAEKLGFEREEIMAIGDSGNDISMIKYAGLGVAMGNAPAVLRSIAQKVVPDIDHDGAAVAMEELLN